MAVQKIDFEVGAYDTLPCGPSMTLCNNAFVDLCNRFEGILSSSFEESPRGDKIRVLQVGDNLIKLMTNSFYALTWLNAKQYNKTNPNSIDMNNTVLVRQVSQEATLKISLDKAIKSFETWMIKKSFNSCRFCDTCGGDYPINGGGGVDENYWRSYTDSCGGNIYAKKKTPKMCCTKDLP